jgi:tetratricopeptide (TPR) repeat protein
MDVNKLRLLISQGENESVDFKLELNLETAEQKAELVKDITSLANSAQDLGFLIIGIDKNSKLIGIDRFEEERIQQITHTYIYPNVILRCYTVKMDLFPIGVIEIQSTERPHRVIRGIDRLAMNDVFVRHGSTIAKASPDEMFRMRKRMTETELEAQALCDAAQKHISLGNINQAITAYSKAVTLMPKAEILLACGRARMMNFELDPDNFLSGNLCVPVKLGSLALKDFSDALKLEDSLDLEKEIRFARLELFSICPLDDSCWDDDFDWAEEKMSDVEYSKVLLFAAQKIDIYSIWASEGWDADKIISLIDRAVELGLEEPKAYCLRANAHHSNQNLGLALKDINFAYGMVRNSPRLLRECLLTRAGILKSMKNYELAYDDFRNAQNIKLPDSATADMGWVFTGDIHQLTDEIYQRVAIQWALKSLPDSDLDLYKVIIQALILHEGQPMFFRYKDDKTVHKFARSITVEKEFPLLSQTLKEIIGKDIWQAASEGREYSIHLEVATKK